MRRFSYAALALLILTALAFPIIAQERLLPTELVVRGEVVAVRPEANQLTLRTDEGKELVLHADGQTTIRVGKRLLRLADLTPGAEVSVVYELRPMIKEVTTAPIVGNRPAPAPVATNKVIGTVVNVKGTNQFILRTAEGKEMPLRLSDRAVVRINNQEARPTDLRPGMEMAVSYNDDDGAYYLTSVASPVTGLVLSPAALVGQVRGRVLEGERPQPNVEVRLQTEAGKDVATQKTRPDGRFLFEAVPPGVYFVTSREFESAAPSVGGARATVEAGKVVDAPINLLRRMRP